MHTLIVTAAMIIAVAAAVRSTWSPCGVSMLATITPLAERGRGHRYRSTALWFVTGAVGGGATLGLMMALLAALVETAHPGPTTLAVTALAAAALSVASDARVAGFQLPVHHRQVNERWLDGFRPWVYGAGFGWQIGSGLCTYIRTAAVYVVVVLAALTGSPAVALGIGVLFGLVRGCAVGLGRGVTSPDALARLHRRLTVWDPRSRHAVIVLTAVAAIAFALALSPWAGLATAAGTGVLVVVVGSGSERRSRPARATTSA